AQPAPAAYRVPYGPYPQLPVYQPAPLPQSPYDTPQARYQRGVYWLRQQQAQELQSVRQAQYEQQQEQLRFARFRQQQQGLPVQDCPPAIVPGMPVVPGAPGPVPQPAPSPPAPGAPAP